MKGGGEGQKLILKSPALLGLKYSQHWNIYWNFFIGKDDQK